MGISRRLIRARSFNALKIFFFARSPVTPKMIRYPNGRRTKRGLNLRGLNFVERALGEPRRAPQVGDRARTARGCGPMLYDNRSHPTNGHLQAVLSYTPVSHLETLKRKISHRPMTDDSIGAGVDFRFGVLQRNSAVIAAVLRTTEFCLHHTDERTDSACG
jgi:hypothetical protein